MVGPSGLPISIRRSKILPDQDILNVISLADQLYRDRARSGAVKESVTLLADYGPVQRPYEIEWRLARALFFLGQEAPSAGAGRQLHAAGIGAGKRAVQVNSARVEGRFWLGVNMSLFAEALMDDSFAARLARLVWSARCAIAARRELKRAIQISERYHGAGPLRVLARLLHRMPALLFGSRRQSRELFERALEICPSNCVTIIYAAELALDDGDRNRAKLLLENLIKQPFDAEWEFEQLRYRERARRMLKEFEEYE